VRLTFTKQYFLNYACQQNTFSLKKYQNWKSHSHSLIHSHTHTHIVQTRKNGQLQILRWHSCTHDVRLLYRRVYPKVSGLSR
jgi:hypothetical protein